MWQTISEMLLSLNNSCKYLILRNYENFEEGRLVEHHDDIDILCEKRSATIQALHAVPRYENDFVHLKSLINGQWLKIDLRVVGDGYYDMQWEVEMLNTRVLYKNQFYVMNDENYYYSLIYHGFFHKKIMKEDYYLRIEEIAKKIGIHFNKLELKSDLLKYMQVKKYKDTGYRSK